jgi:hypothetical protein
LHSILSKIIDINFKDYYNYKYMAKNRPTVGQANWGTPLNDHLNQLMKNGGGINYQTSDPAMTAADDGYTFINTTKRELKRWNGTAWEVLLGGVSKGRERLTADRIFTINNVSGDDNNIGDGANPFKTIQYAVDLIRDDLDTNGFGVTIQLVNTGTPYKGAGIDINGAVTIKGAGASVDTLINAGGAVDFGFSVSKGSTLELLNIVLTGNNTTAGTPNKRYLWVVGGTVVIKQSVTFGANNPVTYLTHIYGENGSFILISHSSYTINSGGESHISLSNSELRFFGAGNGSAVNLIINGSPSFSNAFLIAVNLAVVNVGVNVTRTGGAPGKKYISANNSVIDGGGDPNRYPGSIAGTTSNGGQYT